MKLFSKQICHWFIVYLWAQRSHGKALEKHTRFTRKNTKLTQVVQAQSLNFKSYLTITVLDKIRYSLANNQKQRTLSTCRVLHKKDCQKSRNVISEMIILRKCLSYLKVDNDMSSITQIIFLSEGVEIINFCYYKIQTQFERRPKTFALRRPHSLTNKNSENTF